MKIEFDIDYVDVKYGTMWHYKRDDKVLAMRVNDSRSDQGSKDFEAFAMKEGCLRKYRRLALMTFLMPYSFDMYMLMHNKPDADGETFVTSLDAIHEYAEELKAELSIAVNCYKSTSKEEILDHLDKYCIDVTPGDIAKVKAVGERHGIYCL